MNIKPKAWSNDRGMILVLTNAGWDPHHILMGELAKDDVCQQFLHDRVPEYRGYWEGGEIDSTFSSHLYKVAFLLEGDLSNVIVYADSFDDAIWKVNELGTDRYGIELLDVQVVWIEHLSTDVFLLEGVK